MKRSVLISFLVLFFCPVFGQAVKVQIYLGAVKGKSARDFDSAVGYSSKRWSDYFGLPPITASRYPIEARLYKTTPLWHGTSAILFLDTTFKLTLADEQDEASCVEKDPASMRPQPRIGPHAAFQKLVENAVFSMPGKFAPELDIKVEPKVWDGTQIVSSPHWIVSDGESFVLEYKAGDLFNYAGFRTPKAYWEAYPDNQLRRRQTEIVNAMLCLYTDRR